MKINYDNREPDTALALVKNMVFGATIAVARTCRSNSNTEQE